MHKLTMDSAFRASRRSFLKVPLLLPCLPLRRPRIPRLRMPRYASGRFFSLRPLGSRVQPITAEEFHERLVHAQKFMSELAPKLERALFCAGNFALLTSLGSAGELVSVCLASSCRGRDLRCWSCPHLKRPAARKAGFPDRVRVWQEDENPTKIAASALADRGVRTGRLGVEETAAFTFFDHLRAAAPGFECVSADPLTIACRGRESRRTNWS